MKKLFLSFTLAMMLCLSLTVPALAAEKTIVEAIPIKFGNVGVFHEGLAWVSVNEQYGFISGSLINVGNFHEAPMRVEGNEYYGFIDKTGEIAIPATYEDAGDFHEGLAAVKQNDKWGFIDKNGKEVIPCKYDGVRDFSEGLAEAMQNGRRSYIDRTGKEIIPCAYDDGRTFSEGFAAVVNAGSKWGFIDRTGKEAVSCKYDEVENFSGGLAAVKQNNKWGFIDKTGKEVAPCKYDRAVSFSEGLAAVILDGKGGYIDQTGKEAIPFHYAYAGAFSDGLALVRQNGKYGYIDRTGNLVIPCKYDNAWEFSDGSAPVMQNDKWGYIDKTGKEIVPCKYDDAGIISDGMARIAERQSAKVSGKGVTLYLYGYLAISDGEEQVSSWAKEQVSRAAASGLTADGLGNDYRVNITRAQFAAVSVKLYEAMSGQTAPAAGDSPFSDTSAPAVIQAAELGFVGGVGDGKFNPDALVTREQAAVMLSRVYTKLGGEIPKVDKTSFADDGSIGSYAKESVAFMSSQEIVSGTGNNQFHPKGNASIEQALVIALRMFEKLK